MADDNRSVPVPISTAIFCGAVKIAVSEYGVSANTRTGTVQVVIIIESEICTPMNR